MGGIISLSMLVAFPAWSEPSPATGYVLHFDCLNNEQEARALLQTAIRAGARVINVVPPAHVWERPDALAILDNLTQEIRIRRLALVITRIDASYPPGPQGNRENYLYDRILSEHGRMPEGQPTKDYFCATVGREDYAEWMDEETRFYAQRYGDLPNLLGINLGPFSEPFVSQRGGFLEYEAATDRYEITQYTPYMERYWHRWLRDHVGGLEDIRMAYGTPFPSEEAIPMPLNEEDRRFGKPAAAYFDFVRSINDWFVEQYERCRKIWHQESRRPDVPFILQFSGFDAEKFVLGRSAYAAFDLKGWIHRADAVGLSVYTNGGYPDFGHESIQAMVQLLATARGPGKPVFVLEGGCEDPFPVLNVSELNFWATAARSLHPRTYIYEFLKDPFDQPGPPHSGRMIDQNGHVRRPVFRALRALMAGIRQPGPVTGMLPMKNYHYQQWLQQVKVPMPLQAQERSPR